MNTKIPTTNVYFDERGWICLELENGTTIRIPAEGVVTHETDHFFVDGRYPQITEDTK